MTYIEYAEKLGINLTSAQIEVLNLIEEHKDERLIINFPRMMGRQMLCNLIERKKGYEQGREDAINEFLKKDKECQQNNNECPYMYSDISCVECIANELKEQK